jgi:hypothetical protein
MRARIAQFSDIRWLGAPCALILERNVPYDERSDREADWIARCFAVGLLLNNEWRATIPERVAALRQAFRSDPGLAVDVRSTLRRLLAEPGKRVTRAEAKRRQERLLRRA